MLDPNIIYSSNVQKYTLSNIGLILEEMSSIYLLVKCVELEVPMHRIAMATKCVSFIEQNNIYVLILSVN